MNECCDRHPGRKLPPNALIWALSIGLPGRLKSSQTRFQKSQRSIAFQVNLILLSTAIAAHSLTRRFSATVEDMAGISYAKGALRYQGVMLP